MNRMGASSNSRWVADVEALNGKPKFHRVCPGRNRSDPMQREQSLVASTVETRATHKSYLSS